MRTNEVRKLSNSEQLETYTEFHIAVKGPKGRYGTLRRKVQTFEDRLNQGIAAYMRVEKQTIPQRRIVITIR